MDAWHAVAAERNAIDYDRLEGYLKVLAYASRLELLALLRRPRTLDEIHLAPGAAQAGENPERPISRQAVQLHLDKLEESGLVRVRLTDRKGKRAIHEYALDQSRLFAVCEELRKVSALSSLVPLDPNATEGLPTAVGPEWAAGPKLVLVHGVYEGHVFALDEPAPHEGWLLGRAKEAAVSLEYDPYVSLENARILRTSLGWALRDLSGSRNGTSRNGAALPRGGDAAVGMGDIIGVGRSLLVFRER